uniref:Uncharacterized protein LOC114327322 n=1 Tax=Diabrotica virgifera virgifera TaxID=50390 RepID=A0A6P7F872_DIAVI
MAFSIYIVYVIALAGLVDLTYADVEVQIKCQKTGNLIGADSFNTEEYGTTKLYAKKTVAHNKWIFTEEAQFRNKKLYTAELKDNSKLLLTHSKNCNGDTDAVLFKRPAQVSQINYFNINLDSTAPQQIYSFYKECDKQCLYVDGEELKSGSCDAHSDSNQFVITKLK